MTEHRTGRRGDMAPRQSSPPGAVHRGSVPWHARTSPPVGAKLHDRESGAWRSARRSAPRVCGLDRSGGEWAPCQAQGILNRSLPWACAPGSGKGRGRDEDRHGGEQAGAGHGPWIMPQDSSGDLQLHRLSPFHHKGERELSRRAEGQWARRRPRSGGGRFLPPLRLSCEAPACARRAPASRATSRTPDATSGGPGQRLAHGPRAKSSWGSPAAPGRARRGRRRPARERG